MDNILQPLHELEGVNGSIVADGSGQILGYRAHAVYDAALLQQVSKHIVGAVDSVKLVIEDWDAVTAQYSEGKLLIRNLSNRSRAKYRDATLTVISDTRLNVSFAGVAIRVAVSKLKALLDSGADPLAGGNVNLSASSLSTSHGNVLQATHSGMPGGSFSGAGSALSGASRPGPVEVATSGLNWSGLSGSSMMSSSGVAVADPASSAFLTICTKALARTVGPMAKVFVKEAARKVSPDRPFSRDSAQDLIQELIRHFEDPADATQFRNLVQKSL